MRQTNVCVCVCIRIYKLHIWKYEKNQAVPLFHFTFYILVPDFFQHIRNGQTASMFIENKKKKRKKKNISPWVIPLTTIYQKHKGHLLSFSIRLIGEEKLTLTATPAAHPLLPSIALEMYLSQQHNLHSLLCLIMLFIFNLIFLMLLPRCFLIPMHIFNAMVQSVWKQKAL